MNDSPHSTEKSTKFGSAEILVEHNKRSQRYNNGGFENYLTNLNNTLGQQDNFAERLTRNDLAVGLGSVGEGHRFADDGTQF